MRKRNLAKLAANPRPAKTKVPLKMAREAKAMTTKAFVNYKVEKNLFTW